jgi:UDP-N-acetylglucosamine--N-acetylmuramyl-(pentapeptide) pyrophosphoryl-undecaprenol N-acetylglucosamine transferase
MGVLKKVLIMAGGTGGHVFPGLAVALQLKKQNVEVHWLGTQKGLEAQLVPQAGFPLHFISISGLRGKGLRNTFLAPFRIIFAIFQALVIMRRLKPDVVLGMGGFVSGPGGISSWLLRYPLAVHEQNARAGMTNKWLSRIADRVLEGFPNTFSVRHKTITTGNPVRQEIAALPSPQSRFTGRNRSLRLLVVGGSLGANAINELVPRALALLSEVERPQVYHQTGKNNVEFTKNAYKNANVTADITPFITDMDKAYAWADIVLCRAGALTIAELCAVGLGSILVPYPYAVDDHQTANANYLVKHDAAFLIQQSALTEEGLVLMIRDLIQSPEKRVAMAVAAYQLRQLDATTKVLEICGEICH